MYTSKACRGSPLFVLCRSKTNRKIAINGLILWFAVGNFPFRI